MGLFDTLFGSKKTVSSDFAQTQDTTGTRKLESTEVQKEQIDKTGKTVSEQATQQEQVTRNLDVGTENIIRNLIANLAGGAGGGGGGVRSIVGSGAGGVPIFGSEVGAKGGGVGGGGGEPGTIVSDKVLDATSSNLDFASFLSNRATQTEGAIGSNTEAILTEARRQGENALELQGTQLARGAGSNLNSIVQAASAQGRSDLETQLAGLQGTLDIEARRAGSEDLATAVGALIETARSGADIEIAGQTGQTQQIAQLADILSGAVQETVGTTAATGEVTEEQQITQLLEAMRDALETTDQTINLTGTSNTTSRSQDSLFSNFLSVAQLFKPPV